MAFCHRHDSCSTFGAGLVLLVNLAECPQIDQMDLDQGLIDQNLDVFARLMEHGPHESNSLRSDFQSLHNAAKASVLRSNMFRDASESANASDAVPATVWDLDQDEFQPSYADLLVGTNLFQYHELYANQFTQTYPFGGDPGLNQVAAEPETLFNRADW